MIEALVRIEGLVVQYPLDSGVFAHSRGWVRAVDGVSLEIRRGEVVGLVGESGCGKSTLARALLGLVQVEAGRILFDGQDVTRLAGAPMRALRRRMQITFQDPEGALDPRMTVDEGIGEALVIHRLGGSDSSQRVGELLERVGLSVELADRFPHELSGGQRQRVGLARALAVEPELLVLDEPLGGLDVSVQAHIVNLLSELQERFRLTYLFVSHDLRAVAHLADRVAVMYLGRIVELGPVGAVFELPHHPYTRALLAASLNPGCDVGLVEGEPPSPVSPPPGCPFHPRCPESIDRCCVQAPTSIRVGEGHEASCHLCEGGVAGRVA
ncbi:MAG: ABC transporter ATP-binding protein [Deltaproteobacteria bacterium]|nr:ABC transporter ATP-binding protein [Deltaproteobacteria bacterium]